MATDRTIPIDLMIQIIRDDFRTPQRVIYLPEWLPEPDYLIDIDMGDLTIKSDK
jgi:hypothetical protein